MPVHHKPVGTAGQTGLTAIHSIKSVDFSILITGLTYGSDQWRMPVHHMPVGTAGQTGLTAIQAIKTVDLLFLTTGLTFCAEQQRMRSILITGLTYGSDQWRMPVDHMPVGTAGQTGLTAIQSIKPSIS